jgi:hypothetical protein
VADARLRCRGVDEGDERCAGDGVRRDEAVAVVEVGDELGGEHVGRGSGRGHTRGGDAEPGSRCESDTVLATVTRELEPHVTTGPTVLGRQG